MNAISLEPNKLWRTIELLSMQQGLSVTKLSQIAGVSRNTLAKIESGETRQPQWQTIAKLANALATSVATLQAAMQVAMQEEHDVHDPTRMADITFPATYDHNVYDIWQTYPAIAEMKTSQPALFAEWSSGDWLELASEYGVGGALTPEGVLHAAEHINRRKQVFHQLAVIMESDLGDVAAQMIEVMYHKIQVASHEHALAK